MNDHKDNNVPLPRSTELPKDLEPIAHGLDRLGLEARSAASDDLAARIASATGPLLESAGSRRSFVSRFGVPLAIAAAVVLATTLVFIKTMGSIEPQSDEFAAILEGIESDLEALEAEAAESATNGLIAQSSGSVADYSMADLESELLQLEFSLNSAKNDSLFLLGTETISF
ncbi:MAG: hypothetical protein AAGB34_09795 [Planctomycetota bacterium]